MRREQRLGTQQAQQRHCRHKASPDEEENARGRDSPLTLQRLAKNAAQEEAGEERQGGGDVEHRAGLARH